MSPKFCLTKRPNKRYYIRISSINGIEWKSTGCDKKPAAMEFYHNFIKEYTDVPKVVIPTLKEFIVTFEKLKQNEIRERTMKDYLLYANMFLNLAGNKPLNEYTSVEFGTIRANKITAGWSISAANVFTRSVKAVFGFAVDQNVLEYNPLVKTKVIKTPKRSPLFLTKEEFIEVLSKQPSQLLRDIFTFAVFTGLRLSEILHLRTENIDLVNRQIKVSNSDDFTTKTGNERVVPLVDGLITLIERQPKGVYLFSKKGKYPYDANYVSQQFRFSVRKTTVNQKIHFHSLRHTFASWLVQNSVPIYHVQHLLGHASVSTTEIYSHLQQSTLKNAVKFLPSL